MSFFTMIKTELKSRPLVIAALQQLKQRGEIRGFTVNERKGTIEIDREGQVLELSQDETGAFQVAGDTRAVGAFSRRLAQIYAYVTIKESLPLDFEIVEEKEVAGEITILLKG